ncbi:MAG TPA: zf-HC2 domain-containing protein [Vicinamibacteria bacterium]|nr:zf-HC2 domain-containing protein [Vicinamibacteria bacterium]
MKHTDELTLLRLADGELSPERERAARSHLLGCARCQSSYETLKSETELMRSALRGTNEWLPDSVRPGTNLSWLLAAAIALAALTISAIWGRLIPVEASGGEGSSLVTRLLIRSVLFRGWSEMLASLVQVASILVVGFAIVASVFWAWRKHRSSPVGLGILLAVLVSAGPASGAVIQLHEDTYVLRDDERIDNDLVIAAHRVTIDGIVAGDLVVVAEYVEVAGRVEGDVLGFAGEIEIAGEVRGSVRVGCQALRIEGTVGRNVTAAGESLELLPEARVSGSFTGAGRSILIDAPVGRDFLAAAQTHELNASIGGSARLAGEQLTIGPGAVIAGETRFHGGNEPVVSPEAELASPVVFEKADGEDGIRFRLPSITAFISFWAAAFLLGAVALLAGPAVTEAVTTVHLPGHTKSLVVGVLSVVVTLTLGLVALVTIVGIPLSLVIFFLLALGLYLGQAYVGAYIGREILGPTATMGEVLGRLALGLFLIHLVGTVPVLGSIVRTVVALMGFGALTLWALDHLPHRAVSPSREAQSTP